MAYWLVGKKNTNEPGRKERDRERWRKLSLAELPNWVTAVMICRLSSLFLSLLFHFLFPPPSLSPSGLWEVFIFLMSRWFFFFFFFLSLPHSFWMEGNICHTVKLVFASNVCVCVDCGGAKWCKVFMPWFWLALVGEVDAGVRVVWCGCPVARCCTPSLINMQHGGRFALDLIALIGRTHLQHTHTLRGCNSFCRAMVAPNALLLWCFVQRIWDSTLFS